MDFGCGTGLIANEIAEYVKGIHAIDISSNMIAIAEKKAKERNIANINYAHGMVLRIIYKAKNKDTLLQYRYPGNYHFPHVHELNTMNMTAHQIRIFAYEHELD